MLLRLAAVLGGYAENHRAKGTPEGDRKADANEALVHDIELTLGGVEVPVRDPDTAG